MMVANATGCSSIYGGSAPSTPYCTNSEGHGPAWANSLFEDNAEFGLGLNLGVEALRDRIAETMKEAIEKNACSEEVKAVMQEWLDGRHDGTKSEEATKKLLPLIENSDCSYCKDIVSLKQYLIKKSMWIFGGDG